MKQSEGLYFKLFLLKDQKRWMNYFLLEDDVADFFFSTIVTTRLTPDNIYIYVPNETFGSSKEYSFDMKLGVMTEGDFRDAEASCNVFMNNEDYHEKLKRLKKEYQAEYDIQRIGNIL